MADRSLPDRPVRVFHSSSNTGTNERPSILISGEKNSKLVCTNNVFGNYNSNSPYLRRTPSPNIKNNNNNIYNDVGRKSPLNTSNNIITTSNRRTSTMIPPSSSNITDDNNNISSKNKTKSKNERFFLSQSIDNDNEDSELQSIFKMKNNADIKNNQLLKDLVKSQKIENTRAEIMAKSNPSDFVSEASDLTEFTEAEPYTDSKIPKNQDDIAILGQLESVIQQLQNGIRQKNLSLSNINTVVQGAIGGLQELQSGLNYNSNDNNSNSNNNNNCKNRVHNSAKEMKGTLTTFQKLHTAIESVTNTSIKQHHSHNIHNSQTQTQNQNQIQPHRSKSGSEMMLQSSNTYSNHVNNNSNNNSISPKHNNNKLLQQTFIQSHVNNYNTTDGFDDSEILDFVDNFQFNPETKFSLHHQPSNIRAGAAVAHKKLFQSSEDTTLTDSDGPGPSPSPTNGDPVTFTNYSNSYGKNRNNNPVSISPPSFADVNLTRNLRKNKFGSSYFDVEPLKFDFDNNETNNFFDNINLNNKNNPMNHYHDNYNPNRVRQVPALNLSDNNDNNNCNDNHNNNNNKSNITCSISSLNLSPSQCHSKTKQLHRLTLTRAHSGNSQTSETTKNTLVLSPRTAFDDLSTSSNNSSLCSSKY